MTAKFLTFSAMEKSVSSIFMQVGSQSWPKRIITILSSSLRMAWNKTKGLDIINNNEVNKAAVGPSSDVLPPKGRGLKWFSNTEKLKFIAHKQMETSTKLQKWGLTSSLCVKKFRYVFKLY